VSKLSKQRAKESFLATVEGVDKSAVLDEIRSNVEGDDLYTYFVKKDAFATGTLDDKDVNEFLLKVYSDWYFLHKNKSIKNVQSVKLLSDYSYAPVNLTGDSCLKLVKNGQFRDILPVFFQYINRLEDKYFICIKTDSLYGRTFNDAKFDVRLYLNLRVDKLLDFAKEFIDRAYLVEFPAVLKILNNDYRRDTVVIYTDYEYAQMVVDAINEIRKECPSIFAGVGAVSTLLGTIGDYIGFGEQLENKSTYFSSRASALSNLHRLAGAELLKSGIVAEEKKIIFRTDGSSYTPTKYLEYLLEKNIVKVVEDKIEELEESDNANQAQIDRLYAIREDVRSGVDVDAEMGKLKKSLTRNTSYTLELEGIGSDDFDYVAKLYRIFSSKDDRVLSRHTEQQQKDIVSARVFPTTDTFEGVDTREFLDTYFKAKLSILVKEIIDKEVEGIKRARGSEVLTNIKRKSCEKLRSILTSILDDGDEGRDYIGRCVRDYVRILSSDAFENVEVVIDGRVVNIDTDANTDIISLLPALKDEVDKLTLDNGFIDNILDEYGINKENLCLNKATKNIQKEKIVEKKDKSRTYYYNPEGYLSKED